MKLKKILMLVLILGIGQAFAQDKKDRAQMMTDRLDEKVQLSEEQKTQIYTINQEYVGKIKELRMSESEDNRDAMHQLHKENKSKVEALLSDSQKTTLEELKQERKESRKALHGEMKAYRNEHIKPVMLEKRERLEISLTEEEKSTLEEARKEIRAIRKEARGSKDSKVRHEGPRKGVQHGVRHGHMKNEDVKRVVEEKVQPIIENHRAELDAIDAELQPLREDWKKDMKAIKEKHSDGDHPKAIPHKKGKKKGKKGKNGDRTEMRKSHQEAKFLLMDPNKVKQESKD